MLEKVKDDEIQSISREVGLRFKQGYFFPYNKRVGRVQGFVATY